VGATWGIAPAFFGRGDRPHRPHGVGAYELLLFCVLRTYFYFSFYSIYLSLSGDRRTKINQSVSQFITH